MMPKKVLITGGAGFIGSALSAQLQEAGHEVFVLDDLSFGKRALAGVPDARFFQVDIRHRDAVQQVMDATRPNWVLHLAAVHFIPYCNQHPAEAADININGTINVLDTAGSKGSLEQVFVASTAAVYPVAEGALGEEHPLGPMDIYGTTKLATEKIASEFHLRSRIPVVVGRFFNAFGPNETNPHLFPEIQRQVLAGARTLKLGNLDPKRDYIHTADMGRAMGALLDKALQGFEVFNIGRGIEYSVREVVEAFQRQLGEELRIEVDPARVRKVERPHLLADVRKLKQATGWEPQWSIDAGVATLLQGR
ncbi:MAG: SDR family NAD(P)-dependent oxidoreductase [Bacteroidetes bacterium]|nr:SDR family NAD(P)-dependent oxidoreductase [Bacteroidota bacterium]